MPRAMYVFVILLIYGQKQEELAIQLKFVVEMESAILLFFW